MKNIIYSMAFAVLLTGTACKTLTPPPDFNNGAKGEPVEIRLPPDGEVLYINPTYGYVIVRCTGRPVPGETFTVVRHRQKVGRIRISEQQREPYWVADVLEGTPARGDGIRLEK